MARILIKGGFVVTVDASRSVHAGGFVLINGTKIEAVGGPECSGHGPTVRLHSAVERVKGRADRVLVRIILDDAAAGRLTCC